MSSRHALMTPVLATLLLAAGCAGSAPAPASLPPAADPQQQFWAQLGALCGQAFEGVIGADEGGAPGPDPFAGQRLQMHVRACSDQEIRVPFHVGEDRSRTWVFTRGDAGLRLEHDHRHHDGSADALTMYGGDTVATGTATEQAFPAHQASRDMFVRDGLTAAVANVWIVSLVPGERYSYALTRPGRVFRVDFDLTRPIDPPPPPWGDP